MPRLQRQHPPTDFFLNRYFTHVFFPYFLLFGDIPCRLPSQSIGPVAATYRYTGLILEKPETYAVPGCSRESCTHSAIQPLHDVQSRE